MVNFNWKEYIGYRSDLKKNWNGQLRARIHYYLFKPFESHILKKSNAKNITIFGSCRINIPEGNSLNKDITHVHNTKETLQLIKFLKGKTTFEKPYDKLCFRTPIISDNPNACIKYTEKYRDIFKSTELFILEISSRKKYTSNNYHLHHLSIDKRLNFYKNTPKNILKDCKIEEQTNNEIKKDILKIRKELYPKKLLIISHINARIDGKVIKKRNELINLVREICTKNKIPFIDPTILLKEHKQKEVLYSDLVHYTKRGRYLIHKIIKKTIIRQGMY
jgi:hypothetical protein